MPPDEAGTRGGRTAADAEHEGADAPPLGTGGWGELLRFQAGAWSVKSRTREEPVDGALVHDSTNKWLIDLCTADPGAWLPIDNVFVTLRAEEVARRQYRWTG